MGILDNMFASGNASGTGAMAPMDAIAGTLLQAVGTSMQGASHLAQGQAQQQADEFQAQQLRQNAGQAMASAERSSADVQRQVDLITSRAVAVAAANGGGVSSPSVIANMARIAGEGAYRKSLAIYGGQEQAQHDQLQATATEFSGNMALDNAKSIYRASKIDTAATLMKGSQSLYTKYGKDADPTNTTNTLTESSPSNFNDFQNGTYPSR